MNSNFIDSSDQTKLSVRFMITNKSLKNEILREELKNEKELSANPKSKLKMLEENTSTSSQ